MLLHTINSSKSFPDEPTRQQKRDAKELMALLSRIYPCKECAEHFKEVLKANPVQAGSQAEFSQWLCYVHNVVNRSLGKTIFPCQRVNARWGKLDCPDRACDLEGSNDIMPNR
uniref:Sulfhydryl oxidase n=1 Tax=Aegilops tauschii subsp. strangulata TaxID=200361 RepID=A0A453IQ46_AEGTS